MRFGSPSACAAVAVALAGAPAPADAAEPSPVPAVTAARTAPPLPWQTHLDVGGGVALVSRPVADDAAGKSTKMRVQPGVGFAIHVDVELLRYLRLTGYLVEVDHPLALPPGSFGFPGPIQAPSLHTYSFGVRVSPTLPLGPRARVWLTAGGGWGELQFPTMTTRAAKGGGNVVLYDRAAYFVEVPVGFGWSFDVIPHWLSVRFEATGSFLPSHDGDLLLQNGPNQVVENGVLRDVSPPPSPWGAFTGTLGLSLHL